jgi:hypothetical protein
MKHLKKFLKILGWALLTLLIIYVSILRGFLMHWGSTSEERRRIYPGDSIVIHPATVTTIAITVNNSPSAIWPWIAQMGLNKGGFYSYTWLENIFGCKLHNANVIHPEWQNVKQGDIEPVCDAAAKKNMPGWMVAVLIKNKVFVYRINADSSWTMGYYIDSIDAGHSRLITRMRYNTPEKFWEYISDRAWLEWAHCIMQRGSKKELSQDQKK